MDRVDQLLTSSNANKSESIRENIGKGQREIHKFLDYERVSLNALDVPCKMTEHGCVAASSTCNNVTFTQSVKEHSNDMEDIDNDLAPSMSFENLDGGRISPIQDKDVYPVSAAFYRSAIQSERSMEIKDNDFEEVSSSSQGLRKCSWSSSYFHGQNSLHDVFGQRCTKKPHSIGEYVTVKDTGSSTSKFVNSRISSEMAQNADANEGFQELHESSLNTSQNKSIKSIKFSNNFSGNEMFNSSMEKTGFQSKKTFPQKGADIGTVSHSSRESGNEVVLNNREPHSVLGKEKLCGGMSTIAWGGKNLSDFSWAAEKEKFGAESCVNSPYSQEPGEIAGGTEHLSLGWLKNVRKVHLPDYSSYAKSLMGQESKFQPVLFANTEASGCVSSQENDSYQFNPTSTLSRSEHLVKIEEVVSKIMATGDISQVKTQRVESTSSQSKFLKLTSKKQNVMSNLMIDAEKGAGESKLNPRENNGHVGKTINSEEDIRYCELWDEIKMKTGIKFNLFGDLTAEESPQFKFRSTLENHAKKEPSMQTMPELQCLEKVNFHTNGNHNLNSPPEKIMNISGDLSSGCGETENKVESVMEIERNISQTLGKEMGNVDDLDFQVKEMFKKNLDCHVDNTIENCRSKLLLEDGLCMEEMKEDLRKSLGKNKGELVHTTAEACDDKGEVEICDVPYFSLEMSNGMNLEKSLKGKPRCEVMEIKSETMTRVENNMEKIQVISKAGESYEGTDIMKNYIKVKPVDQYNNEIIDVENGELKVAAKNTEDKRAVKDKVNDMFGGSECGITANKIDNPAGTVISMIDEKMDGALILRVSEDMEAVANKENCGMLEGQELVITESDIAKPAKQLVIESNNQKHEEVDDLLPRVSEEMETVDNKENCSMLDGQELVITDNDITKSAEQFVIKSNDEKNEEVDDLLPKVSEEMEAVDNKEICSMLVGQELVITDSDIAKPAKQLVIKSNNQKHEEVDDLLPTVSEEMKAVDNKENCCMLDGEELVITDSDIAKPAEQFVIKSNDEKNEEVDDLLPRVSEEMEKVDNKENCSMLEGQELVITDSGISNSVEQLMSRSNNAENEVDEALVPRVSEDIEVVHDKENDGMVECQKLGIADSVFDKHMEQLMGKSSNMGNEEVNEALVPRVSDDMEVVNDKENYDVFEGQGLVITNSNIVNPIEQLMSRSNDAENKEDEALVTSVSEDMGVVDCKEYYDMIVDQEYRITDSDIDKPVELLMIKSNGAGNMEIKDFVAEVSEGVQAVEDRRNDTVLEKAELGTIDNKTDRINLQTLGIDMQSGFIVSDANQPNKFHDSAINLNARTVSLEGDNFLDMEKVSMTNDIYSIGREEIKVNAGICRYETEISCRNHEGGKASDVGLVTVEENISVYTGGLGWGNNVDETVTVVSNISEPTFPETVIAKEWEDNTHNYNEVVGEGELSVNLPSTKNYGEINRNNIIRTIGENDPSIDGEVESTVRESLFRLMHCSGDKEEDVSFSRKDTGELTSNKLDFCHVLGCNTTPNNLAESLEKDVFHYKEAAQHFICKTINEEKDEAWEVPVFEMSECSNNTTIEEMEERVSEDKASGIVMENIVFDDCLEGDTKKILQAQVEFQHHSEPMNFISKSTGISNLEKDERNESKKITEFIHPQSCASCVEISSLEDNSVSDVNERLCFGSSTVGYHDVEAALNNYDCEDEKPFDKDQGHELRGKLPSSAGKSTLNDSMGLDKIAAADALEVTKDENRWFASQERKDYLISGIELTKGYSKSDSEFSNSGNGIVSHFDSDTCEGSFMNVRKDIGVNLKPTSHFPSMEFRELEKLPHHQHSNVTMDESNGKNINAANAPESKLFVNNECEKLELIDKDNFHSVPRTASPPKEIAFLSEFPTFSFSGIGDFDNDRREDQNGFESEKQVLLPLSIDCIGSEHLSNILKYKTGLQHLDICDSFPKPSICAYLNKSLSGGMYESNCEIHSHLEVIPQSKPSDECEEGSFAHETVSNLKSRGLNDIFIAHGDVVVNMVNEKLPEHVSQDCKSSIIVSEKDHEHQIVPDGNDVEVMEVEYVPTGKEKTFSETPEKTKRKMKKNFGNIADPESSSFSLDSYLEALVDRQLSSTGKDGYVPSDSFECSQFSDAGCQTQLCGLLSTIHSCKCLETHLLPDEVSGRLKFGERKRALQALNLEALGFRDKKFKMLDEAIPDGILDYNSFLKDGGNSDMECAINHKNQTFGHEAMLDKSDISDLGIDSTSKESAHPLSLAENDWEEVIDLDEGMKRKELSDHKVPDVTFNRDEHSGLDCDPPKMNEIIQDSYPGSLPSFPNCYRGAKVLRLGLSKRAKLPRLHQKR